MKFEDPLSAFFLGILLMIIIAALLWVSCSNYQDDWWRNEMVRRGYAHWYVDEAGIRQWNWTDGKEPPKSH